MTDLAFGAWCGALTAIGLIPAAALDVAAPSKVPNAIAPSPTPQSSNRWRRVMRRRRSLSLWAVVLIVILA
jgi:hypothetical protein